jgi:hypothetical protein
LTLPGDPDAPREQLRAQLRLVEDQLRSDDEPAPRQGVRSQRKFGAAIDRLEQDIARLSRELSAETGAAR